MTSPEDAAWNAALHDARREEDLRDTRREMRRHDTLWGEQNHRDLGMTATPGMFAFSADDWKRINEARVNRGPNWVAWDGILLEEVYEALGEPDEDKMRVELVQVAAVALQWAGAIRRRQKTRAA